MSNFAVLGATGRCGSALVRHILTTRPDTNIKLYARNEQKLLQLFPSIRDNSHVQTYCGPLSDIGLLRGCIEGTDAVFLVVASNDSTPQIRVSQDVTECVIAACASLLASSNASGRKASLPKIILLNLGTVNKEVQLRRSLWSRRVWAFVMKWHILDLALAKRNIERCSDWLDYTIITPGGLSLDRGQGYTLSFDTTVSWTSYDDLAAGMVEIAETSESITEGGHTSMWSRKCVAVASKEGVKVKGQWDGLGHVLKGLLWRLFPWLYWGGLDTDELMKNIVDPLRGGRNG